MLSRTADHLYWMARYTERAENLARMLDVTNRMTLIKGTDDPHQGWSAIIVINSLEDEYAKRFSSLRSENVIQFMAFDETNPSSICSCLRLARENAHAVRGTLTAETWETINTTWIDMAEHVRKHLSGSEITDFFEWVKFRSHLTRGVTVGTMLRDEALDFIRLGTFLERADSTARLLDVKYHVLLPSSDHIGGAADYYQWSALLRSFSAFVVYRRVYRDVITPLRVAELLILREDMPRSLHACMSEVYNILCKVKNQHSRETERRAGELHAELHYGRIDDIFDEGLHEYLNDFIDRTLDLGNRIARDFLVPPVEAE